MFISESGNPQQRLRASHLAGIQRLDSARVPVFGLPLSWQGQRSTGTTCFETGVTRDARGETTEVHESVELVHRTGESELRIESCDQARPTANPQLLTLLDRVGTCSSMTVIVDGKPELFACAVGEDRFVARRVRHQATVTLIGDFWPITAGLEIVRIGDLAAYHEGRLQNLEERSGFNRH